MWKKDEESFLNKAQNSLNGQGSRVCRQSCSRYSHSQCHRQRCSIEISHSKTLDVCLTTVAFYVSMKTKATAPHQEEKKIVTCPERSHISLHNMVQCPVPSYLWYLKHILAIFNVYCAFFILNCVVKASGLLVSHCFGDIFQIVYSSPNLVSWEAWTPCIFILTLVQFFPF